MKYTLVFIRSPVNVLKCQLLLLPPEPQQQICVTVSAVGGWPQQVIVEWL